MRSVLLVCALLMLGLLPVRADAASWVLAMPPLTDPTKVGTTIEEMKAQPPSADRTREMALALLDRTAAVDRWQPGPSFPTGEACEDARLGYLRDFDRAVSSADSADVSDGTLQHLTTLARSAFGRCVPSAFAPAR